MVHKVINRCLVAEFYKQNAAFFGLIILIFFGFIKSSEHLAIGGFIVSNPFAMLILFIIWMIYLIKILFFVIPTINLQQNHFLDVFVLLSFRTQVATAILTSCLLLLPALGYATFLLSLSIGGNYWMSLLLLIVQGVALVSVLSAALVLKLRKNRKEASFFHIRFLSKLTKPPYLFFTEHLIRNEIVLLLLTKIYTCILIIGTAELYNTDTFDIRLMTTGILLSLVGNVAILHKYTWFHFHKMALSRNLPLSFTGILLNQLLIISLLILPELSLILRHYPLPFNLFDLLGLMLFAIAVTVLTYSLLIIKQKELSNSVLMLFWLIVISTIIILFSVHPLILGIIGILISFIVMYLRYDKFEYLE